MGSPRSSVDRYGMNALLAVPLDQPDVSDHAPAFLDALLHLDRASARELARGLAGSYGSLAAVDQVIAPAMRQIGDLWACGEVDVAQEHAITVVARDALAAIDAGLLSEGWRAAAPRAVCFAPEGERHELPVIMVAAVLEGAGWQVLCLGCDLPAKDLAASVRLFRADVACMSLTTDAALDGAHAALDAMATAPGEGPRAWIGGGAVERASSGLELATRGGELVGRSMTELADRASRFMAERSGITNT